MMSSENTLRTLNDLGEDEWTLENGVEIEHKGFWIPRNELKQEAIKWVKSLDKYLNFEDKTGLSGLIATIEWIRLFFNLTEEELK